MKYIKVDYHQTKDCPKCGKDTYLTYWEKGKCPHCGSKIGVGNKGI